MSETFLHGVRVLEVESGSRPIRTAQTSVIGLVGTGDDDGVVASVEIGTGNGKVRFEALNVGASGNLVRIEALNPNGNSQALTISEFTTTIGGVTYKDFVISLATDGSGAITSTANQVIAAFNASSLTQDYAVAEVAAGSTGASVYAAHVKTGLAGGVDSSFPLNTPVLVTSPRNVDAQLGADTYLGKALEAIYKQAGAVCVVVRTADEAGVGGDATSLTGVYALKRAKSLLGVTPRIIAAQGAASDTIIDDVKSVAASLRAMIYVGAPADMTSTEAMTWMTANGNDRTMLCWPTVNGGQDLGPFYCGVRSRQDNDRGFWWSVSNQEIFGVESVDQAVDWQMGDTTSLANILNEGKVSTVIREGGFRTWGNLTGAIDPRYQFESVRRTADVINETIQTNFLWAVDRPVTPTYLSDVADSVTDYMRTLQNLGAILGGTCWPDPDLNSPDQIALGKVYFDFDFTPPYPAQTLTFRSILTNDYLTELV